MTTEEIKNIVLHEGERFYTSFMGISGKCFGDASGTLNGEIKLIDLIENNIKYYKHYYSWKPNPMMFVDIKFNDNHYMYEMNTAEIIDTTEFHKCCNTARDWWRTYIKDYKKKVEGLKKKSA